MIAIADIGVWLGDVVLANLKFREKGSTRLCCSNLV